MPDALYDLSITRQYRIRSNETDISGNLRPGALVNLLIQTAIDSADELGFGLAELRENSFFWALSRLMFSMDEPIKWRQNIVIETWPKDIDGLHYLRDFRILDTSGNELGTALSGWLLLDVASKRPRKLEESQRELFCRHKDRHARKSCDLRRLVTPGEAAEDVRPIESTYFDFDLNGHVTATRYIDWIMNTFSFDYHKTHRIQKLWINFVKELLPEDGVSLSRYEKENDWMFVGRSIVKGVPSFVAEIEFNTSV